MFQGLVVATLLISAASERFRFPVERCKDEVREARERLRNVVEELATEESENRLARLWNHLEKFGAINTDHSEEINEDCGERTPTLFPPTVFSKDGIQIPSIFGKTSEDDAYVRHMHMLYENLLDENKICNVNFQGLNSITEEQLYGAATLFATNHASPICPICTYVVRLAVDTLVKNLDKLNEDIRHLIEAALKIMPPAETVCSGMIPICKDAYKNGTNEYNSTECFKCSFCMSGTTLLQHNFLQDQNRVDGFERMLEKLVLNDFCTELCYAYPPGNSSKDSMFPNGISKQQCIDKSELAYKSAITIARHALIPNNFCPVIGVCPHDATPNILHCLHEYCIENQRKFSFLAVVCDMIPDHPDAADEYLNIASQKKKLRASTSGNREEL